MAINLDDMAWARRLKFRHLEVFLVLHETGSMTAAATRLHMTQPALSHWLADVESAIGRPLFVRGRTLTLTDDGAVLLAHADRMLGDIQRTHAEFEAVRAGLQGRLNVGTGLPRILLPKSIARMHKSRPGIFVSVLEAPQPDLIARLAKRELDVVIGALTPQALSTTLTAEPLLRDQVTVVARADNPLLSQRDLNWSDLSDQPWILPPEGAVMRQALNAAFAAQGLRSPVAQVEANSSIRVQLLMEDADHLSVLSRMELDLYQPAGALAQVDLHPPIAFPDIGALWDPARESPVLNAFLVALREEARWSVQRD